MQILKKKSNNVVNIDQMIYCVVFSEEVYVWLRGLCMVKRRLCMVKRRLCMV